MGFFAQFNQGGVDFMDGRQKGSLEQLAAIDAFYFADYGVIPTKNGDCPVFIVKDLPNLFFFGNTILLDIFTKTDEAGRKDELLTLPVSVDKVTNRQGTNDYWKWTIRES